MNFFNFHSEINLIDEVNNIFQTKFIIVRYWNDHNLDFMNLNGEDYLDEKSQGLIWLPLVTFHNTLRKVKGKKMGTHKNDLILQQRELQEDGQEVLLQSPL